MQPTDLNFLSKNLEPLSFSNISKKSDVDLCILFEQVLCAFHNTGSNYLSIDLFHEKGLLDSTYLKCIADGQGVMSLENQMDSNTYRRLSEIIFSYGVFFKPNSGDWQPGLIIVQEKELAHSYSFIINAINTNTELGWSFSMRWVPTLYT